MIGGYITGVNSSNHDNIITWTPPTSITFGNGSSLDWSTGKLVFKGCMDESAIAFFVYLKSYIDAYIKENAPFNNLEYLEWLHNKKFGAK